MTATQLASRIDAVKIYAAGATVTRIAELPASGGELPEIVEIAGLPLALDDSSLRVRVEAERENAPIAGDVRIGLAVPERQETPAPSLDEEVRAAAAEVRRIEDSLALIDNEIEVLHQLQVPSRPAGEAGKAPPPSPMSARLALANFSDELLRARIQEKRETREQLRLAQENLADLQQKQARASSARDARPDELRKSAVVSLSYQGDSPWTQPARLVVEYFVPGARWTPAYVCRLNSAERTATIAVRGLICQRTGEDWSGVRLELSTAEPVSWCELPQLRSLRLGRQQPVARKVGWRPPPVNAEILFEDFDRQQEKMFAATQQVSGKAEELSSVDISIRQQIIEKLESAELEQSFQEMFGDLEQFLSEPSRQEQVGRGVDEFMDLGSLDMLAGRGRAPGAPPAPRYQPAYAPSAHAPSANLPDLSDAQIISLGETTLEVDFSSHFLNYGLMRMGAASDPNKRGGLSVEQRHEAYLEILMRQKVAVSYSVLEVVRQAVSDAKNCLLTALPAGGINVREVADSFDYAYSADGRVDVPSDGEFHSVALTAKNTTVEMRYVVVPRQDSSVFRIVQLRNPLSAPLLAGPADIYVDGEYILSANIATVPPKGQMELGLGVEQAIKVARNTSYEEIRSGETLVALNELHHKIKIEIANNLSAEADIEVRERVPMPQKGAKVDVLIESVSPAWEKYEQLERGALALIESGYRWRVQVPPKDKTELSVHYIIKTFVDSEIVGGNRRED
jgi:hypothetical protein